MASVQTNYTSQKTSSSSSDCGNKNCPKHGENAMARPINPSATTTKNFIPRPPSISVQDINKCNNKNCPKHSQKLPTEYSNGQAVKITTLSNGNEERVGINKGISMANGTHEAKDANELVEKTQRLLRISAPVSKTGGTNNVVTFITNNNNTVENPYMRMGVSPSVSPMKQDMLSTGSGSGMYDQLKMEHTLKENLVLQSITIKQNEDILQLKNQLEDLQSKLEEEQTEKNKLKVKVNELINVSQESKRAFQTYQDTIKTLKARLHYTDLKAKQLKRMASENAATASKWRAKLMESLEAQNELEEKKNASAKATLGIIHRQFLEEKKNLVDLKSQHGVQATKRDFDETTLSTTIGTVDSMMDMTSSESSMVAEVGHLL